MVQAAVDRSLYLPAGHNYGKTNGGNDGREHVDIVKMTKDECQLLDSTAMTDVISGQLGETEFREQLLHEDDETDG